MLSAMTSLTGGGGLSGGDATSGDARGGSTGTTFGDTLTGGSSKGFSMWYVVGGIALFILYKKIK